MCKSYDIFQCRTGNRKQEANLIDTKQFVLFARSNNNN